MCLYPRIIANPKYKPNKKNGGKIPPVTDPRVTGVPIGCGNCIECRKQKARNWQIRLLEEIKYTQNAYFITLTFNDQSIAQISENYKTIKGYTLDNQIATTATRYFLERWRKTHKKSLRHWLITELGHNGTNNIHMHGIIWLEKKEDIHKLDQHWQYGYTYKGTEIKEQGKITGYKNYVNPETIAYIIKYITKQEEKYKHYKPIILCSPGIGNQYTKRINGDWEKNKYNDIETKETYITTTGHKIALPTYYRNKIYTDEEKEALWLIQLNKEKRYVLGNEIDISNGQQTYLNALEQARIKNASLGYGTSKINYDQKHYEQQIREQMTNTRIQKGKNKK